MESLLGVALGLALSAACGFRVFVPLLIASLAARSGHVTLAQDLAWIGSDAALVTLVIAAIGEVAAYMIPWFDNFLDVIAAPLAVVAGIVLTASVILDMSPLLRWALALIAGGGIAGTVQSTTTLVRATSTATTGGLGNHTISVAELGGAVGLSLLALAAPWIALALVSVGLLLLARRIHRIRLRRRVGDAP